MQETDKHASVGGMVYANRYLDNPLVMANTEKLYTMARVVHACILLKVTL